MSSGLAGGLESETASTERKRRRHRDRVGLATAGLIVAALVALSFLWRGLAGELSRSLAESGQREAGQSGERSGREGSPLPLEEMDWRLHGRPLAQRSSSSAAVISTAEPKTRTDEIESPKPTSQPPGLPFEFQGTLMVEGGPRIYYLEGEDRAYAVKDGEVFAGNYRVNGLKGRQLSLTYLPLGREHLLSLPTETAASPVTPPAAAVDRPFGLPDVGNNPTQASAIGSAPLTPTKVAPPSWRHRRPAGSAGSDAAGAAAGGSGQ